MFTLCNARVGHLPFTITPKRLAALHAIVGEWLRALDPWRDDSTLDAELAVALERVSSFLVQKLAVRYPQEHRATLRQSVYYKTAYAVSQGEVEVSKLVAEFGCHRKTVSRYLRGFVDEGWVRRVRRGVYALKIYTT